MLCSARELLLGDDHDGIIELPADAKVGEPAAKALGLTDPVIDVSITPNRGDATSVYGIARDLAAAGSAACAKAISRRCRASSPRRSRPRSISRLVKNMPRRCSPGRLIRGVKNGPSPQMAAGLAEGGGPAPDLGAGRRHQFPVAGSRAAAACVRCRQAERQSARALRQGRRAAAGARRQDLHARLRAWS